MWQLMVAGAGLSFMGSMNSAKAVSAAGKYNQQVANRNAAVATQKGKLKEFRAEQDAVKFREAYDGLLGQQTTEYAKGGMMVGTGSALEVAMKSAEEMDDDIATLEYNARAEAGDLRDQAENLRLQGVLARYEAKAQAKAIRMAAFGKFATSMASVE
tara:strand:- start:28 stop:498 length:471 start_codon:yes stop_codon:yes gene_type:complete